MTYMRWREGRAGVRDAGPYLCARTSRDGTESMPYTVPLVCCLALQAPPYPGSLTPATLLPPSSSPGTKTTTRSAPPPAGLRLPADGAGGLPRLRAARRAARRTPAHAVQLGQRFQPHPRDLPRHRLHGGPGGARQRRGAGGGAAADGLAGPRGAASRGRLTAAAGHCEGASPDGPGASRGVRPGRCAGCGSSACPACCLWLCLRGL